MKKIFTILLLLLYLCPSAYSQKRVLTKEILATPNQEKILLESIGEFQIVEIDLEQLNKDVTSLKEINVIWNINESMKFDMHIIPDDIRSPSYIATIISDKGISEVDKGKITTYKGYLTNGKSSSGVRLTIDEGFIHGSIQTDKGEIIIDQLKYMAQDKSLKSNQLVLYNSKDVKDQGGVCGTSDVLEENKKAQSQSKSAISNTTGCKVIEVALDCDNDYWNLYNDGSFNRMLSEINMIQDVYDSDLDAVMSVTSASAFISGGAYSSSNPNTIISEINTIWTSSPWSGISRDLVHHFTGKTTGIYGQVSRIGAVCDDVNPRAFTEDRTNAHQTVAHEIGHLLNARHSEGTNCGTPYLRSIMCQGDNKALEFSSAAITRITNHMNNWSCLNNETVHITGSNAVCVNSSQTFSLNNFNPTGSTSITWSLSNSRASIISGQGTQSVVVKGNSSGQVSLTATINYPGSSCGTLIETRSLQIGSSISYTWSGPGPYGQVDVNVTGGTAPWKFYRNGSTLIHTSYSSSTTVPFGCSGGSLEVRSTTSCGTASYTDIIYGSCGGSYMYSIYPNPSTTEIKVVAVQTKDSTPKFIDLGSKSLSKKIVLTLLDFTGNSVSTKNFNNGSKELKMDVSTLPKGIYFLRVLAKEVDETHTILIK